MWEKLDYLDKVLQACWRKKIQKKCNVLALLFLLSHFWSTVMNACLAFKERNACPPTKGHRPFLPELRKCEQPSLASPKHLHHTGFLSFEASFKRNITSFHWYSHFPVPDAVGPFSNATTSDSNMPKWAHQNRRHLLLDWTCIGFRWHNDYAKQLPATHLYQHTQKSIGHL